MKYRHLWLGCLAIMVMASFALPGCATMRPSPTVTTEDLLVQAGFKPQVANTPQKEAHLRTLPQGAITPMQRGKQVRYVYADAKRNVLYIGDREAWDRFHYLALERKIAAEKQKLSEMHTDPEFWSLYVDREGGP